MPSNHDQHVSHTSSEWENVDYFCKMIDYLNKKNIKIIIDVGANVGEVTNIFLNKIKTIECAYLFEPEPSNYNFIKNKFNDNNKIFLYNCGIYYGITKSKMYRCDDNVGGFSIEKVGTFETEEVELKTLEDFNFNHIDFIKLDVEGSEYNIIENSSLIKNIKYIEIEIHPIGLDSSVDYSNKNQRKEFMINEYFKKYLPDHKVLFDWECHFFLEKNI